MRTPYERLYKIIITLSMIDTSSTVRIVLDMDIATTSLNAAFAEADRLLDATITGEYVVHSKEGHGT